MDDSVDSIMIEVELGNKICYVDSDKYLEATAEDEVYSDAMACAFSEFSDCQNNQLSKCKFIDCFNTS